MTVGVCSCCKTTTGITAHTLTALPLDVFRVRVNGKPLFQKKDLPAFLCGRCDGDALEGAQLTLLKRND